MLVFFMQYFFLKHECIHLFYPLIGEALIYFFPREVLHQILLYFVTLVKLAS